MSEPALDVRQMLVSHKILSCDSKMSVPVPRIREAFVRQMFQLASDIRQPNVCIRQLFVSDRTFFCVGQMSDSVSYSRRTSIAQMSECVKDIRQTIFFVCQTNICFRLSASVSDKCLGMPHTSNRCLSDGGPNICLTDVCLMCEANAGICLLPKKIFCGTEICLSDV